MERVPAAPTYRPEIDGLRAVAVMMVLFHHAGFSWASGGFVGVDIFFVLSGHVIATLAFEALAQGRFSIAQFYERRARRIMPALIVMTATLVAPAYWLMLPNQLIAFARNMAATLMLTSNIRYWRQGSYFSERSELNPLQHSWTLAVEGQFYLLFPLLIPMLRRLGVRPTVLVLTGAMIFSLALSEWASHWHPAANFYLAPSRAWELIAGVLSALAARHGLRIRHAAAAWVALPLLTLPMFIYDGATPFPGLATVPIVVGTVLILLGEPQKTPVGKALTTRPLVTTGLMSYSLYLWHQPLFAFYRLHNSIDIPALTGCILILLVFPIAYLSWRFLERPLRRPNGPLASRRTLLCLLGLSIGTLILIGQVIVAERGFRERMPPAVLRVLHASFGSKAGCLNKLGADAIARGERCFIGAKEGEPSVAVIGDSHATSIADDLSEDLRTRGVRGMIFTWSWCPPLAGLEADLTARRKCTAARDEALRRIASDRRVTTVLFYAEWANYTTGYTQASGDPATVFRFDSGGRVEDNPAEFAKAARATFETLVRSGKRLVIIRSTPEFTFRVPMSAARLLLKKVESPSTLDLPLSAYRDRSGQAMHLLDAAARGLDIEFVDPIPVLCPARRCPVLDERGEALYFDHNHLSRTGVRLILPLIGPLLADTRPKPKISGAAPRTISR